VVVCVNKMDLVDWDAGRFGEVEAQARELTSQLGIPDTVVIPISALEGDNVVQRSERTPWYQGPPLLDHLHGIDLGADRDLERLRMPVQWVARGDAVTRRAYTGQVVAGALREGDEVVVVPAGSRSRVASLDTLDPQADVATPALSVTVELEDDLDIGRGDVLVSPGHEPPAARELDATLCWMGEEPLRAGRRYALKHTTRTVRATVQALHERTDPETLQAESEPRVLELNDIGRVTMRTSSPVLADPYAENRATGSFILIDEHTNDTVAAGLVLEAREVELGAQERRDVTWHPSALDRGHRWERLGQRGATVWLTGLPASGKSTIAVALERALVERGQAAYLLDGDNVRHGLSDDLGFSPGDRAENMRRVGHVARLLADAGVVAVVSLVSPLAADRAVARELHDVAGLDLIEVHVNTSAEECARRDPKGLYAKAKAGEIKGFTGVDAPYEEPEDPEVRVDTASTGVGDAVTRIIELLED
jgi:bifunctional enzyme CysN/CysC